MDRAVEPESWMEHGTGRLYAISHRVLGPGLGGHSLTVVRALVWSR